MTLEVAHASYSLSFVLSLADKYVVNKSLLLLPYRWWHQSTCMMKEKMKKSSMMTGQKQASNCL